VMWQFSEAIDGLTVACNELGTPITGGNVSFYNETLGKSIYPTPVIGVLGILEDASRVLKIAFRDEGDVIVLLDGASSVVAAQHAAPLQEPQREFSSSEYSKTIAGIVAGEPPAIDLAAEKRLQECLVALANGGAVRSAHDVSDGGIAVTLVESCFAAVPQRASPPLGAKVKLPDESSSAEYVLFGERGARAVVSVKPTSLAHVLETARQYEVAAHQIGQIIRGDVFRIEYKGRVVIESSVSKLHDTWAHSLERGLKAR
jgi:phosphoribosylformylglycinamidine (FGAM) synthase-like enzyme